jgi:Spy/CpxP family protein refolding chaperone
MKLLLVATLAAMPAMFAQNTSQSSSAPQASQQQSAAPGGKAVEHRFATMVSRLKLTPDQADKIKPILEEQSTKMLAMRQQGTGTPTSETRAQMRQLHEDTNQKIAAILTEDQKAEYAKMQAEQRGRMREHRGNVQQQ